MLDQKIINQLMECLLVISGESIEKLPMDCVKDFGRIWRESISMDKDDPICRVDSSARAAIASLRSQLNELALNKEACSFFTDDAFESDPDWNDVKVQAKSALSLIEALL